MLSSSVYRKMQTPMSDAVSVIKSQSSSGSAEFVAKATSKRIVKSISEDESDDSPSSSSPNDEDSSSSLFDKENDSSESSPVAVSDTSPLVIKPMAIEQSQDRLFGSMVHSKKRKVEFQTGEKAPMRKGKKRSGVADDSRQVYTHRSSCGGINDDNHNRPNKPTTSQTVEQTSSQVDDPPRSSLCLSDEVKQAAFRLVPRTTLEHRRRRHLQLRPSSGSDRGETRRSQSVPAVDSEQRNHEQALHSDGTYGMRKGKHASPSFP